MAVGASSMFFFFQAEDGIRDLTVTGVQTCALPILPERTCSGTGCSISGTSIVFCGINRENHAFHSGEAHRGDRSEEHTSELQSQSNLVCRLLLEKKKKKHT